MKKILGWILCLVGLFGIASTTSPFNRVISIPLPDTIAKFGILPISIVILVAGLFIIINSGSRKLREVPIYQGKNIVGYRRQR